MNLLKIGIGGLVILQFFPILYGICLVIINQIVLFLFAILF